MSYELSNTIKLAFYHHNQNEQKQTILNWEEFI